MDSLLGPTDVNILIAGFLPLAIAGVISVVAVRHGFWKKILHLKCGNRAFTWTLIAGAALLLVCGAFIQYVLPLDYVWDYYFKRSVSMIERGTFAHSGQPTAFFPPGYSIWLVPFVVSLGANKWALIVGNLALLILTTVFVRWLLVRIEFKESLANIVALFVFLYPTRFFSVFVGRPDIPFSLLVLVGLLLLLMFHREQRYWQIAAAGVCFAAATLMRPNGLLFSVPVAVFLLLNTRWEMRVRLRSALLFVCALWLLLTPWIIRNAMLFSAFVPTSTSGGYNLLSGMNPYAAAYGTAFYPDSVLAREGNLQWSETQRDSFWMDRATRHIAAGGIHFAQLGLQKVVRSFASDSHALGALKTHTNFAQLPRWTVTALYFTSNLMYYLIALAFLAAVWTRWQRDNEFRRLMIAFIGATLLTVFIFFGLPRYKEPFGAVAIVTVVLFFSSRNDSRELLVNP